MLVIKLDINYSYLEHAIVQLSQRREKLSAYELQYLNSFNIFQSVYPFTEIPA